MIEILTMVFISIFGVYSYISEKIDWNEGKSSKGYPWVLTSEDRHGTRYYTDNHGSKCTINWNVDRKRSK